MPRIDGMVGRLRVEKPEFDGGTIMVERREIVEGEAEGELDGEHSVQSTGGCM